MNVFIMGSGRSGSLLASMLSEAKHEVTVIDWSERAFARLSDDVEVKTVLGNAMDYDVLKRAGIESADAFVAATSGDNRNIMAGEIARHVFQVPRVIARIKDPSRAGFFSKLGLEVDCRTTLGTEVLLEIVRTCGSQEASQSVGA